MLTIECLPHDRIEFRVNELGQFTDLIELPWVTQHIARIAKTRVGIELQTGPYVGRLVIPQKAVINVREPFPGTVAACLQLAKSGRKAATQGSPPGTVRVEPWSALAEEFTKSLSDYVMRGIERQYTAELITTSRPRGHVELARTAKLIYSRGREDEIICRPRVLSEDTSFNRASLQDQHELSKSWCETVHRHF